MIVAVVILQRHRPRRAVLHCALSVVSPCPLCGLPPFRPQVMWNLMRVMWRGRLFAYLWSPCAVGLHLCHFLLKPHLRPTGPYNVRTHPGPPHPMCILTLYSCKRGGETKIDFPVVIRLWSLGGLSVVSRWSPGGLSRSLR